jgi:hypothetical protein
MYLGSIVGHMSTHPLPYARGIQVGGPAFPRKRMPLLISSFKDTIRDEYISLGAFVRERKFVVMKIDVSKQEKNIISQANLQGKW